MIRVRVLDAVALSRDGVPVALGPGKVCELFVRLALEPGVMVRTDRLIEDLWDDDAPSTARNTLQATVSRLRRVLGVPDLVTGSRAGYTLNVDRGAVDAVEVLELAQRASASRRGGDPVAARSQCPAACHASMASIG